MGYKKILTGTAGEALNYPVPDFFQRLKQLKMMLYFVYKLVYINLTSSKQKIETDSFRS